MGLAGSGGWLAPALGPVPEPETIRRQVTSRHGAPGESMQNRDRHDPREPESRPRVAPHAALEEVGDFHYGTDAFSTALEYYEGAVRGLGVEQEFDPAVAARLNRKVA